MFVLLSIALRESFSQCLFYNEIKSATGIINGYSCGLEYKNNYYLAGCGYSDTDETVSNNSDYYSLLVKTDACGNTIWKKFIRDQIYGSGISRIIQYDGYIYVMGGTAENARKGTVFFDKLNEDGDVIWQKVYRSKNNDINTYDFFIDNNQIIAYGNHENMEGFLNMENMHLMVIDTAGSLLKEIEYNRDNGYSTFLKMFKTNRGYVALFGSDNFKYSKDSILYSGSGVYFLNNNFDLIGMDTFKSNYYTGPSLIDFNPALKKYILHLTHWISNDTTHRQIAILDSIGKLEKIIEDPFEQNLTPQNLIAFDSGWVAGLYSILIKYNANYEKQTYIQITRNDTGIFHNNSTTVVKNGKGLLVAGTCRQCNPYDDNSNSPYDRPTAIMIDSNFRDFGKAQPPYEAPKPFVAIKAFPNPALESITLQITETSAEYAIYNSMGMFVSAGNMPSSADISLLNMASGMYIIQLKSPQGNYIGYVKFLKK